MRLGYVLSIGLLYLSVSPLCVSQSMPKLEQVLPRIQDHVKEFELSLPDFICDERITSRELMGGKINHETFIESEFRGTQSQDHDTPFTESREIKMIDGRPAAKDQQLAGPFFFGGGFSSIVAEVFSRKNRPYFDFKISGTEAVDGKAALVIKFKARNNQKALLYREMFGTQVIFKGSGKALIDPESMNVMRLEVQFLDPPFPEGVLSLSVDYAGVEINGKTFWMTVTAEQTVPNPKMPVGGQYIAEYSNYHQFNVSVHIKY